MAHASGCLSPRYGQSAATPSRTRSRSNCSSTWAILQKPGADALGLIDDDTYFETLEYHLQWLARAGIHLTTDHPWDLLFVQTHAPDYANHFFMELADPICGAPGEGR